LQNKEELIFLYRKFVSGTCTDAEMNLLFQHFNELDSDELNLMIRQELDSAEDFSQPTFDELTRLARVHGKIRSAIGTDKLAQPPKLSDGTGFWLLIAAAVLLFVSLGIIRFSQVEKVQMSEINHTELTNDVGPGGNKAFLTLANGTKLSLTDSHDGELAEQAGISIVKAEDGQLVYNISRTEEVAGEPLFNTIETPRGGQYQINLPDGSRIWLNAASSLRYPVVFAGKERKVELTGEAYFEIARDESKPFRIASNNQLVEVLGTHFNINAYPEEGAVKTSLLEGSVKVRSGSNTVKLQPGQQSLVDEKIVVAEADVFESVAWKNGKTQFSNADIQTIMRMLSRWYNVEVEYQGEMIGTGFGGSVSRSKNISEILKLLELTGDVHFKIEGRRVTVMP
jgi:transmembrane sensor